MTSTTLEYAPPTRPRGLLGALRTQPDLPVLIGDAQAIDQKYRYWRVRILTTTIIGYALFYFVRANDAVPVTRMMDDLGYTRAQLGLISSFGGVTYGVSKFINGFLGDHANPRYFMALGLLVCAGMNVGFGASSTMPFFIGFWTANMWAQGMGFPPCAKSMAFWFSPTERNRTFGIWHISHMIGGAAIQALTGYLVIWFGWRSCFYIPAGIAAVGVIIILWFLRDTPGSLGLPPVEVWRGEETARQLAEEIRAPVGDAVPGNDALDYAVPSEPESYRELVIRNVLLNPWMWVVSIANAMVYFFRWMQMKWGPTFLQQAKGISLVGSGWLGFSSELAGLVSALTAGIIADRYFKGRAGRVCVIAMAGMSIVCYLFWKLPAGRTWQAAVLFILMGFFLYIPQMLIAALAMHLGTKRASAAAVGMTGLFGYLATIPAGWGVGWMADHYGWGGPFALMLGCAIGTMLLMLTTWNIGGHSRAAH
jgi:OPA family glycerol-3-phosphate transporter-like MFS transporter/OPA family sugar phosphate sensor protein UhpC-like MFS transporter